jgi:hypothetical protein
MKQLKVDKQTKRAPVGSNKPLPVESNFTITLDEEYRIWLKQVVSWLESRPHDPCSGGPEDDLENLIDIITEKLSATKNAYNFGGVLPAGAARSVKQ